VEWLASFLDCSAGWVPSLEGEVVTHSRPRPYTLTRVADHPRLVVLLCEPLASAGVVGIPPRRQRRRWWRWIQRDHGSAVVVFTDAAHSAFVWAWGRRERMGLAYGEHRIPGREESLTVEMAAVGGVPRATDSTVAGDPWAGAAVVSAVRRRIGGNVPAPTPPGRFACWIGRQESPRVLRAVWRALGEVALLDPDCGEGDWLLGNARVLESLHAACLERMRCLLDDAGPSGCREGRLADLAALVTLSEDRAVHPGPVVFIRRLILQRNLYSVVRSRREARSLVRRVREYGELSRPAIGIDFHLKVAASRTPGGRPAHTNRPFSPARGADSAAVLEEVEALAFTVRYLQDSRMAGACSTADVRAPAREVRTRCTTLRQCLPTVGEIGLSGETAACRSTAALLKGLGPCLDFLSLTAANPRCMTIVRRR